MEYVDRAQLDSSHVQLTTRNLQTGPAVGHIDLSYHTVRFDGDLNATSSYRGDPSDALDEAWDKYEDGRSNFRGNLSILFCPVY